MISIFTRPIIGMDETEVNLLHRVPVDTALRYIDKLESYYGQSSHVAPSSHPICNLISLSHRYDYTELSEYLRVVLPPSEYRGRILGMPSEIYGKRIEHQGLTASTNFDIILTISDYTSDEILTCIYHPWTYIDYRMPTGDWNTTPGYTIWTLNLVALFTEYFKRRHDMTINNFVHGVVFARSVRSIMQYSLINRVAVSSYNGEYDVDDYDHPFNTDTVLKKLDKQYKDRLIAPNMTTAINSVPSLVMQGQYYTLHLPSLYRAEHISRLWFLARVGTIATICQASTTTLHRLERYALRKMAVEAIGYTKNKKTRVLPEEYHEAHSEDINYLNKL